MSDAAAFLDYAARIRPEVEAALDHVSQYDDQCPTRLREAIRHSLLAPGKRLRPLLVLMAFEACGSSIVTRSVSEGSVVTRGVSGGSDNSLAHASGYDRALPAACAVEMVHTYSLIHDDLPAMDDDDLRRGLPTCHAAFDEATAILAGDALLAQAFEVLASGEYPASVGLRACLELGQAAGPRALVGGQADDLAAEHQGGDLAALEHIHRRKTGALFLVSLRLGGLVAEANEAEMRALDRYGRSLGLAFQIVDDLLDLASDDQTLGKRTNKDSDAGKLTFPALLGVEESQRRAAALVEDACDALTVFGERGKRLRGLAKYVLERKN
jgi:geranylgeranyl diphosphate synthase type II